MNNHPIILAHGIARFDILVHRFSDDLRRLNVFVEPLFNELHYFRGILRHLTDNGFRVYQSSVGFAKSVDERAIELKSEVEKVLAMFPDAPMVHIIGHSMGGLDARHMIVDCGMKDRVASVTTIGTPHNGTTLADVGMDQFGEELVANLDGFLDLKGFADLTRAKCAAFNARALADEASNGVFYQTYSAFEKRRKIFTPLQMCWDIIDRHEGDNDGLVPVTSQAWTDELSAAGVTKKIPQHRFPFDADHLNECGWWELNQLGLIDGLTGQILPAIAKYERAVRDVYLGIASDVCEI